MANDIIDINVTETIETVAITVQPNLTTINVNQNLTPVTSVNGQTGDVVIPTPTLDSVLTDGNASLLNANIGGLGLYDLEGPAYSTLTTFDHNFIFTDYSGNTAISFEQGNLNIHKSNSIVGSLSANLLTVSRGYYLPDASGTIALTSDIPTIPTLTSQLTNDGANGVNPFITALDIPASNSYGLFAQTADGGPVTATTVETSVIGTGVGTLTVPANGFKIGDSFQASLDGILSCVGTATLHIHIKTLAGVILADTGIIAMDTTTSKSWLLNLYFTIRNIGGTGVASISSGGLFSYIKNSGTQFEGYVLSNVNNTTFNTTINNTLVVTVQWNTNNAGNSILSRNFTLTKIH